MSSAKMITRSVARTRRIDPDSTPRQTQPNEPRKAAAMPTASSSSSAARCPSTPVPTTTSTTSSSSRESCAFITSKKCSLELKKTRCYRFNLEKQPGDSSKLFSAIYRDKLLTAADLPPSKGPHEYCPSAHYLRSTPLKREEFLMNFSSSSEQDGSQCNKTDIAFSTAGIFRGITIDNKGKLLGRNAQAETCLAKEGTIHTSATGEMSKQVTKIEEALKRVDDIMEGNSDDDSESTNILSLHIMGEYDELHDLVRDGSKRLREGKSLSDEAVLSQNRSKRDPPCNSHSNAKKSNVTTSGTSNSTTSCTNAHELCTDAVGDGSRRKQKQCITPISSPQESNKEPSKRPSALVYSNGKPPRPERESKRRRRRRTSSLRGANQVSSLERVSPPA